jgi:hypothetical protein
MSIPTVITTMPVLEQCLFRYPITMTRLQDLEHYVASETF